MSKNAPAGKTIDPSLVTRDEFLAALLPGDAIGRTAPRLGDPCVIVSTPWLPPGEAVPQWSPKAYIPGRTFDAELYVNWATCKAVEHVPQRGARAGGTFVEPRASNESFHEQHFLMLDDIGNAEKSSLTLDDPRVKAATYIIETSKGNFQVGYALATPLGFEDNAQLRASCIAAKLGDAGSLNSPHRWCRVPGSVNMKPGRDNWRSVLRQWHPERRYTLDELATLLNLDLTVPVTQPGTGGRVAMPDDIERYQDIQFRWMRTLPKGSPGSIIGGRSSSGYFTIACPWAEGNHSVTLDAGYRPGFKDDAPAFRCHHRHGGKLDTKAFADWCDGQPGYIKFREQYLGRKVANATEKPKATRKADPLATDSPQADPEPALGSEAWFAKYPVLAKAPSDFRVERPPMPQPVIEHWLPRQVVTLFGAHGGEGKSYVALEVATRVALGLSVFGCRTERTRVAVYSCEDSEAVMRHRADRIAEHLGFKPADLDGWLFLFDMTAEPEVELFVGRWEGAYATELAKRLHNTMRLYECGALVVDNASDVFAANENARAEVRHFMRDQTNNARRGNYAILLLAHVNKLTASVKAGEDAQGYSGSTAWHNSARSRWFMAPEEGSTVAKVLVLEKSNYGKRGLSVEVKWHEDKKLLLAGAAVERSNLDDMTGEILTKLIEYADKGLELKAGLRGTGSTQNALRKDLPQLKGHRPTPVQDTLEKLYRDGYLGIEVRPAKSSKSGVKVSLFVVTDKARATVEQSARIRANVTGKKPQTAGTVEKE